MVNVGREAMLSIGCIQALKCHTGHCPTGVATQSQWLMHGLDPDAKEHRCANYVRALRGELLALARSCGVVHPALVEPHHLEIVSERYTTADLGEVFGYLHTVDDHRRREIEQLIGPPKDGQIGRAHV